MPFDALTRDTDALAQMDDALARLNIVPVSSEVVFDYKRSVERRFADISAYRRDLLDRGYALWRTTQLSRDHLAAQLADPPTQYHNTPDLSGAPKPLIALARHVRENVKSAEFALDYFDTDPILYVHYDQKSACLGIWDQSTLVAIADWQRPSILAALKQRFPRLF